MPTRFLLLCLTSAAFLTGLSVPVVQADEKPETLTVCTWNVEWLFDNYTGDNSSDLAKKMAAPSRPDWDWKLAGVEKVVREVKPSIIGFQEIENRRVMFYLTQRFKDEPLFKFRPAFVEGDDFFTEQDVGLLSLSGMTGYGRREMTREQFETKEFFGVQKHVVADYAWGAGDELERLFVINVHFRAQPEQTELRKKQAKLVRSWINNKLQLGENVIVMGDVNTNDMNDETTAETDLGVLRGLDTPDKNDDLYDTMIDVKTTPKETHLVHKQFDRILISKSLLEDAPGKKDLVYKSSVIRSDLVIRGKEQDKDHMDIYWSIPAEERDTSDHYPLVAEFEFK